MEQVSIPGRIAPTIEKIMVFKRRSELPDTYKFLSEYIPDDREKVIVTETSVRGKEIFLHVRCSSRKRNLVLSVRHFRTVGKDKLREKLLAMPVKNKKVLKILDTL